jgi:transcriptional regulatory protein RtcR
VIAEIAPSPSYSVADAFRIRRFKLPLDLGEKPLAEIVSRDISAVSPETEMHLHQSDFSDPWDFEQV